MDAQRRAARRVAVADQILLLDLIGVCLGPGVVLAGRIIGSVLLAGSVSSSFGISVPSQSRRASAPNRFFSRRVSATTSASVGSVNLPVCSIFIIPSLSVLSATAGIVSLTSSYLFLPSLNSRYIVAHLYYLALFSNVGGNIRNKEKAAQKVRLSLCSLPVLGLFAAKCADILFCIVIFMESSCHAPQNAYIIRTEPETAHDFYFSFLLDYVTILLQILWIFVNILSFGGAPPYEHTV